MTHYLYLFIAFALSFLSSGGKWNIPLAAWLTPIFLLRFYRQSNRPWLDFLLLWVATAIPLIVSWNGATFFPRLGEIGFQVGPAYPGQEECIPGEKSLVIKQVTSTFQGVSRSG